MLKPSQRGRLTGGAVAGLVAGVIAAVFSPWQLAVLTGWDLTAIIVGGSILAFVTVLDGEATEAAATREDLNRAGVDLLVLAGSLVSLVGVLLALISANKHHGVLKATMIGVAVLTVVASWALVHTLFTLRYARLYYDAPRGGIDFPDEDQPDYRDFAYLSFTIGMTFQVSDTDISQQAIRRAITRHSLLGYVFGTVIVGITINVVGGLIN